LPCDSISKSLAENCDCRDLHSFCYCKALFWGGIWTSKRGTPWKIGVLSDSGQWEAEITALGADA
jgi:hypothetical protein